MIIRIAKGGAIAAALLFVLGLAAFLYGSSTWGWAELAEGWWWYNTSRFHGSLALLVLTVLTVVLGLVCLGLSIRGWRRFRSELLKVGGRPSPTAQQQRERQLRRRRLAMDREFCHPRPRADRLVDQIFGCIVDLEARSLRLTPGPRLVELSLELEDSDHPLTTITFPVYKLILDQLLKMLELEEGGSGQISLRSSRRVDSLEISIQPEIHGSSILIEALEQPARRDAASGATGTADGSPLSVQGARGGRPRKRSITLARMEQRRRSDPVTGEFPLPFSGEEDTTDSHIALMFGMDPSSEIEISPVVQHKAKRPKGPLEQWLRLTLVAGLFAWVLVYFWDALAWGGHYWASQQPTAPWRDVTIEVRSLPRSGEVTLDGKPLGRTPLKTTLPCRGSKIEVLIQAGGYKVWQWSGICPDSKQLSLLATLQPH